jgi:protein-S-isoprenylcysteine O-methyltransferase Ste14
MITTDIYLYIRHNIYIGILITCYGYTLYNHHIYKIEIAFLLAILLTIKSSYEYGKLKAAYSDNKTT